MSVEANKAAARRFVEEALDGGDVQALQELFLPGAVRHFPPGDVRVEPTPPAPRPAGMTMKTEIHHLFGEGDFVTIHLTHHVTFEPGGRFRLRIGIVDTGGQTVEWNAMAILQFKDGKIAEEWVVRDELQVLEQLGIVKPISGA